MAVSYEESACETGRRNRKLARKWVTKVIEATSQAVQTLDDTDLTREELEIIGRWLGTGVANPNNDLDYSESDPDSLIQAGNRYLAVEIANHYRAIAQKQEAAVRGVYQPDTKLWTILAADDGDFRQIDEDRLNFSTRCGEIIYQLDRVDRLPPMTFPRSKMGKIAMEIYLLSQLFEPAKVEGDFLQFGVNGLRLPYRQAMFVVPLGIDQSALHQIGATPNVTGWKTALSEFQYRVELVKG